MLSQQLLSQRIPWEGGARRPKGDGRREGSRGAAKETATPPRPRRVGGEYVFYYYRLFSANLAMEILLERSARNCEAMGALI